MCEPKFFSSMEIDILMKKRHENMYTLSFNVLLLSQIKQQVIETCLILKIQFISPFCITKFQNNENKT